MNSVTRKKYILLTIIFILAFIFRIWKLGTFPWGFHVDELNAGYIGRYILLHGKDVYGNFLPFVFDKFGDFRPTGIYYLSGLSTFVFGINAFAVRFPSALFGALSTIAIWIFAYRISNNKVVAYSSAGILAMMPWHIDLSRATSESIIGLFFVILGLALFKKPNTVKYGVFALIMSYFFYHTFRLLVPLILLISDHIPRKIILFFIILTCIISLTPLGRGRFMQVAFWQNPAIPGNIVSLQNGDGNDNVFVARLFHNKPVAYSREFLYQYISYFSPQFLFFSGGLPERYVVPDTGAIQIVFLPFFLWGIVSVFRKPNGTFLLLLLVLSPLPAALTYEDAPNLNRAIMMIVPVSLITAYGISAFIEAVGKQRVYVLVVLCMLVGETVYFFHQYAYHSPSHKSLYRNDGDKEVIQYVISHQKKYDTVLLPMARELSLYYLFYTGKFDISPDKKFFDSERIGNIRFIKSDCPSSQNIISGKRILSVEFDQCTPTQGTLVKTIMRRDSTGAYKILEF